MIPPDWSLRPIIGSLQPLRIGEIRVGMKDATGKHYDQPFLVLREATFDEWLARLIDHAGGLEPPAETIHQGRQPGVRFYEISTD